MWLNEAVLVRYDHMFCEILVDSNCLCEAYVIILEELSMLGEKQGMLVNDEYGYGHMLCVWLYALMQ